MKLLLGVFSSALICYALDTFFLPVNRWVFVAVTFVLLSWMAAFAIGIRYELPRTGAHMRLISGIGYLVFALFDTLMFWSGTGLEMFVIVNGALCLIVTFALITIFRARQ